MTSDTICNVCNKEFIYKSRLAIHQTRKKPCTLNTTEKNIDFTCCGKNYKTSFKYKQHQQSNLHKTINDQIKISIDNYKENVIAKLRV